jgi:crotonobetainyl-CoA:carnitine CoA-transferase CaiB-like acyl-CoA transferase
MAMLDGVRVVELGTAITAPLAAMLLADMGADVIKVERPGGDPYRQFPRMSPAFAAANRNKRSIVCDIRGSGKEDLRALLADADVFIENMRPGVTDRLGFGWDALSERFPRLIYCSVTGFGPVGPYRDRPAFDGVAQAICGLTSRLIDMDTHEPSGVPVVFGDVCTGMYAAIAVLGALVQQGRTGKGARLELNMLESTMAVISYLFASMVPGTDPDRALGPAGSQSYIFRCADGLMLAIHLSSLEKFWLNLLEVADARDLADDPRYRTRPQRVERYHELSRELGTRFAQLPRSAWIDRLRTVDIPYAPVQTLLDVANDPQVAALGTIYEIENDVGPGRRAGIQPPMMVDGKRPVPMRPAPELGSHKIEDVTKEGARP